MATFIPRDGQRQRIGAAADTGPKPGGRRGDGLATQLLAAVELFGVDDTRAALREIRERDAAKETSR